MSTQCSLQKEFYVRELLDMRKLAHQCMQAH